MSPPPPLPPPPLIGPLRRDIVIAPETLTRDDPLYTLAHTVEKTLGTRGGGGRRGRGGAFQVFSRQHNSAQILGGRKKTGTGQGKLIYSGPTGVGLSLHMYMYCITMH
jgi:hypothetical protein